MNLNQWNVLSPSRKILKKAKKLANYVDSLKVEFRQKTNKELSEMTNILIDRLKRGQSLDDVLPEALATAREAIYRVHHIFAYKVQLIGAIVANYGDFAEMYTGEGKTIVIILTAYLNALLKRGVHIVTVNEYLVQRDARFCAEALNPLGITVGYNLASFTPAQKREMFACDITYTTNSELGFDYLRDNMVNRYEDKVIRELNFAIIDEGDSVLIDEARTPLIISGQPKQDVSLYIEVDRFVNKLGKDDFIIDAESNSINLTDEGVKKAEAYYKLTNLFHFQNSTLYHKIKNALLANKVFRNGVEYIVKDDKVFLVDQFTGRILEGRSYNAGLQQAIQAKEKVKIEPENITVATITYQSFFRLYNKLAGLSGTAVTEAEEFLKIYNMVVVTIPTNKPVIRRDMNDYVFANKISKWVHVVSEIEKVHATGQPILVGTESVEDSDISTNMAGRGTDIKLGPGIAELGGLYVIGTAHHESRRVDNQLRGRSGRQGDPGITRFFVSLEDTLFRRFAIEKENKSSQKIDDEYYDSWFFTRLIKNAQKKVEALNYDMRKNLIDYDSILSNQRELVYKQRDQILKNSTNLQIAKNMAKVVAKDVVDMFKSPKNPLFVKDEELANAINKRMFNYNLVSPSFFENKTVAEATNILFNILCISIDKRVELLTPEVANKIFRDIIIQSLDHQWTNHLDLMVKVREGVNLRSLEQRSPLNIYVEEADKHFEDMKQKVAHATVIQINHIFVPRVNEAIFNELSNVLSTLNINKKAYEELKSRNNDSIIQNAFESKPNFSINLRPTSPRDKFVSQDSQTKSSETSRDAKKTLSNLMEKIKSSQQQAAQDKKETKKVEKPVQKSK